MSIFKDTFIPEVQNQLEARQNAIKKRDVTSIKYLNSRNAWIRMSSSVNVNGTNELADNYQLKGGIISPQGLRAGVFNPNNLNAAYDNQTPLGEPYQRGIRPMPGINSIDIKSKSAYGSLREVVVKFQCWDIKQLEDLELLYMRPGYTVLIEWGWTPYLKNDGSLKYTTQLYDIIQQTPAKEKIWEDLFNESKNTGGNYDAMFGYVKNYSWSAREDGGYDCSTTIISIGEIIESLKINYTPLTSNLKKDRIGFLKVINLNEDLIKQYKKNILAGLFAELYATAIKKIPTPSEDGIQLPLSIPNNNQTYDFYLRKLSIEGNNVDKDKVVNPNVNKINIYIKLDSLINILNKYVILQDVNVKSTTSMVELSTYERKYDKTSPTQKPLLCLGHPLQISVDPTICLIGNDFWTKLKSIKTVKEEEETQQSFDADGRISTTPIRLNTTTTIFDNENTKYLKNLIPYFTDETKELGKIGNIYINLQFLYALSLDNNVEAQDKKEKQEISLYDFLKNVMSQVSNCIGNINNFDIHVDPSDNIARIIDINYVNEASKAELTTPNPKRILPEKILELQMHNLSSTVRSYKLESQIFQEQSSIVAIGAQAQGGALGTDSNTINGFNRGIIDRIIPRKEDPTNIQGNEEQVRTEQLENLKNNLNIIYDFFGDKTSEYIFWSKASYDAARAGEYKGALRDLIAGFISFSDVSSKYNAIIPTKLSIEMDGIGGLVIGHIFRIPDNLLPKGYKNIGDTLGAKLGYIITGIGHRVSNNDWVTNIDAQTIILDNPRKNIDGKEVSIEEFFKLISQGQPFDLLPSQLETIVGGVNRDFNLIASVVNTSKGSVDENSKKYPVLINNSSYKSEYNSLVQKEIKITPNSPVANSLRKLLDKNYIIEKDNNISSNGDITESLKTTILKFQNKIKNNRVGFNFVTSKNPIVITAGNDTYHRTYGEKRNSSTHCRGLAIDIRTQNLSDLQIRSIMVALKESGFTYVIFHGGSALHIHANINPN
jgi:hypothetical protein